MRRVAALGALLALAGCGGDGDKAADPDDVLRAAQRAILAVDSFHIEGTQTDTEGTSRLAGDVTGDRTRVVLRRDGGVDVTVVVIGDDGYMRGNRAFWVETGSEGAVVDLLSDRWVRTTGDDSLRELSAELQPEAISACITDRVGTLSVGGTREVDGRETDVVIDAGDEPGTAPGELYVATEEPRLPLRFRQTAPRRPGGPSPSPECSSDDEDEDDTPTVESDITLSRFDEPVEIEPPANALDLDEVEREATGESEA